MLKQVYAWLSNIKTSSHETKLRTEKTRVVKKCFFVDDELLRWWYLYKYAFGRGGVLEEHHHQNKNSQRGFLRRNFLFRLSVSLCFCHSSPQIPSLPLSFPPSNLQRAFLVVSHWITIPIGASILTNQSCFVGFGLNSK